MTVLSTAGPTDGAGMPPAPRPVRRTLLIIGGAEDKLGRSVVLRRFVRLPHTCTAAMAVVVEQFELGVAEFPADLARHTGNQRLRRDHHALRHHRPGGHQGPGADHRIDDGSRRRVLLSA